MPLPLPATSPRRRSRYRVNSITRWRIKNIMVLMSHDGTRHMETPVDDSGIITADITLTLQHRPYYVSPVTGHITGCHCGRRRVWVGFVVRRQQRHTPSLLLTLRVSFEEHGLATPRGGEITIRYWRHIASMRGGCHHILAAIIIAGHVAA